MKFLAALCLVAVVVAAPPPTYKYQPSETATILRLDNENDGVNGYKFGFEQSDGQRVDQQGEIVNKGSEDEYLSVKGSYSWVGPDGVQYIVNYIADDKGFQPEIEQGPGGGVPPGVVASLLG